MHILLDESIPGRQALFARLGSVRTFSGRTLRPGDLAGADALIVRSVTRVDAALLAGSKVRFVATATAGADHVDTAWLAERGIAFADAPGCNAPAVAEYVMACLLTGFARRGESMAGRTLGIVGVGQVGRRVEAIARRAGMAVLRCDPPRARREAGGEFVPLETLLAGADAVTLHVPLTRAGPDATANLLSAERMALMRPGAVFINTARGDVVDEAALAGMIGTRAAPGGEALLEAVAHEAVGHKAVAHGEVARGRRLAFVAVDTWRGEPAIDAGLALACDVATPHIAGYSRQARRRAAAGVFLALARWCGSASGAEAAAPAFVDELTDRAAGTGGVEPRSAALLTGEAALTEGELESLRRKLRDTCPIERTTAALQEAARSGAIAARFDELRQWWAQRDETR